MFQDNNRPFTQLIANYAMFRLALLNQRLTSPDLEYNSLAQIVTVSERSATGNHSTDLSLAAQPGERPLDLRGYLSVFEDENSKMCHVVLKRATHGARSADIELDEIWLDGNHVADYLSKFWTFLVTGKWD